MTHFFQYAKVNQHQVTQLGMSNSQVMLTQEKLSYSPFKWDYIKVIESKSKIAKQEEAKVSTVLIVVRTLK